MLIKYDVGWGQCHTCVNNIDPINTSLNIDNYTNPIGTAGQTSFQSGLVTGWHSAYNSPHHVQVTPSNPCLANYTVVNGTERNCLAMRDSDSYSEGIFKEMDDLVFDADDNYTLSLDVSRLPCTFVNSVCKVNIKLTNDLTPYSPLGGTTSPPVINHLLLEELVIDNYDINNVCVSFSFENHNDFFRQIYIHTERISSVITGASFINIDNFFLRCETTALDGFTASINNLQVEFEAVWGSQQQGIASYLWNFGDGNTSTSAIPIHNYTQDGYYEVCLSIINDNGCCAQECREIVVGCPTSESTFTVEENECGNFTFTPTTIRPNTTYIWTAPGGAPVSGNGATFTTEYIDNGNYNVSLRAVHACGQSTSVGEVVVSCIPIATCMDQTNCISIGENANSVTLLSDLMFGTNPTIPNNPIYFGYDVKNLCFSVQGKLIVDVGLIFFTNTNWFMGPGAVIELLPTFWGSRYFIDSQFQGCDMMWRGIVVKSPPSLIGYGGLSIIRTTIKDASRGVELENFSALNSENSSFIDNSTGIFIGYTLFSKVITTEIKGTNFENRNGMLPNYPFQQAWNERMAHGIYASNVVKLDVVANPTSKNRFLNTIFGIRTVEVNLNVQNSIFEDSDSQQISTGINISKIPLTTRISQGNEFINLTNSIHVNQTPNVSNLYVEHNIFNNIRNGYARGINLHYSQLLSVVINENDFDFVSGKMITFEPLRSISIENNRFYMSGAVIPIYGVGVKNKSKINNNIFEANLNSNFPKFCITLSGCSFFEVMNNIMYGDVHINGAGGIMSQGNNKCLFRENKVNFDYNRAFYVVGSENVDLNGFCCNNAVFSGESNLPGFHFLGENGETRFRQNKLFSLKLAGKFGPQMNAGNEWLGLGSSAELLGNPGNNRFTIDQNISGAMPSIILPVIFSSEWFHENGIHPTCSTSPTCNIEEFFAHPYDPDFTNTDPDPQDTIIVIVDPARPYCSVVVELFDRLDNVDSIASPIEYWSIVSQINKWRIWKGESWVESCLNTSVTYDIDIDPWYDVEKEKDKIYHVDEDIRQEMAPIMQVVYDLNDQLDTVSVDSTMILPPHAVIWYDSLKNVLDSLQVLNEQIQQDILDKASSLIAQVNALPTPLPFLVDRKKVWQVEMKYIVSGLNAISEGEWSQIRIIANKCPLETGQAVFEAMSLLKLIDEDVEMNTNCPPVVPKSIKKTPLLQPVAYPNPGTGLFVFEIPESIKVDKCIILDMFGRTVWQNQIQAETNSFGADISQHNAGMYLYFFKNGDETIYQGKLIVIE